MDIVEDTQELDLDQGCMDFLNSLFKIKSWDDDGMNEELCKVADDVERGVANGTIMVNTVHEPTKRKKAIPNTEFGDMNVQWEPTAEGKAEVERAAHVHRVTKAREEYKALNLGVTVTTVDLDDDVNQVGGALTRKQAEQHLRSLAHLKSQSQPSP